MKTKPMPTQEYLKQCLDYDPETGVFTWKDRPVEHFKFKSAHKRFLTLFAGNVAGFSKKACNKKYIEIRINSEDYKAHRLALIMSGIEIPCGMEVDHIDGNGENNSLSNLRVVDRTENSRNQRLCSINTSGVSGVTYSKSKRKWQARIKVDYNYIHLGYFSDFCDAVAARKIAEVKFGFHENHGTERPL